MRRDRRSDQQLLDATRAGDADAFGRFFLRHEAAVLMFLRRRADNAETAAELLAETFAAALLAIHKGHISDVPNGAAWLLGIARHKLVDSYRSASIESASRREIGLPKIAVHDWDIERIDQLAGPDLPASEALQRLSSRERDAVIARIVEERDYAEIASSFGQSEVTIRKRVSRGLAHLREAIEAQAG